MKKLIALVVVLFVQPTFAGALSLEKVSCKLTVSVGALTSASEVQMVPSVASREVLLAWSQVLPLTYRAEAVLDKASTQKMLILNVKVETTVDTPDHDLIGGDTLVGAVVLKSNRLKSGIVFSSVVGLEKMKREVAVRCEVLP